MRKIRNTMLSGLIIRLITSRIKKKIIIGNKANPTAILNPSNILTIIQTNTRPYKNFL